MKASAIMRGSFIVCSTEFVVCSRCFKFFTIFSKLKTQKETALIGQPLFRISAYLPGNISDDDTQDSASQDVTGKVHEQIHAGKSDDTGEGVGRYAQTAAEAEQDRGSGKEKEGMT